MYTESRDTELECTPLMERSIGKALVGLSVPIILANVLGMSHQLVNMFWLGRLGVDAVAAASASFPLIFLIYSLGGGLAVAGAILSSLYTGAGDQPGVRLVSAQALLSVTAASVPLAIAGYFVTPSLLNLLHVEAHVFEASASYLYISFLGMAFMFFFSGCVAIFSGIGRGRMVLSIVIWSVFLNVVLDPVLIFGWGQIPAMGVRGAAWATFIAEGLASVTAFAALASRRYGIGIKLRDFIPDISLIKRILRLGLPASMEHLIEALGVNVMTLIVASFGTLSIATYGIVSRLYTFFLIPALSIATATATLVGQNIGAGANKRAAEIAVFSAKSAFLMLMAVGLLLFFTAADFIRIFVPNNPELLESAARAVHFVGLSFGFFGVQLVLGGAFRGASNTMTALGITVISIWGFLIPLAFLFARYSPLGADGLWLAYPVAGVLAAAVAMLRFKTYRW